MLGCWFTESKWKPKGSQKERRVPPAPIFFPESVRIGKWGFPPPPSLIRMKLLVAISKRYSFTVVLENEHSGSPGVPSNQCLWCPRPFLPTPISPVGQPVQWPSGLWRPNLSPKSFQLKTQRGPLLGTGKFTTLGCNLKLPSHLWATKPLPTPGLSTTHRWPLLWRQVDCWAILIEKLNNIPDFFWSVRRLPTYSLVPSHKTLGWITTKRAPIISLRKKPRFEITTALASNHGWIVVTSFQRVANAFMANARTISHWIKIHKSALYRYTPLCVTVHNRWGLIVCGSGSISLLFFFSLSFCIAIHIANIILYIIYLHIIYYYIIIFSLSWYLPFTYY